VVVRTKAIAQLKALIVNAPEQLRHHFRPLSTDEQLARCARLRTGPSQSVEHRSTIIALRLAARRALALEAEAATGAIVASRVRTCVRESGSQLAAAPAPGNSPGPSTAWGMVRKIGVCEDRCGRVDQTASICRRGKEI
jgi:hypothetical protein